MASEGTKEEEDEEEEDEEEDNEIKGSAFGICMMRTMLSLLPPEAGELRYDERTPRFEGVALSFNPEPKSWHLGHNLEAARENAFNYDAFVRRTKEKFPEGKDWHGLDFNYVRAHFVDSLIVEAVSEGSLVKQIVFCGVGQDYRSMRYGEEIRNQGAIVFELDLSPMIRSREKIKAEICKDNEANGFKVTVPETHMLPIDFGKQKVSEVLKACSDFDPQLPTLYLWEGVTYYLLPEAMRAFFVDIHELMCGAPADVRKHHSLFFDHLIDLPILAAAGDEPAAAMLDMFKNSEPLLSFLNFDDVESYLASIGFGVHRQLRPPAMYKVYQKADQEEFNLRASPYFGLVVTKPATETLEKT